MDALTFWTLPGVVRGLVDSGHVVVAPDRLARPSDWSTDTAFLAKALPPGPVVVVGGSNGCTPAVRLVLERPGRIGGLVLAWPATCGDQQVDARCGRHLADQGADDGIVKELLGGQTLRGIKDAELAALSLPVAVVPSLPANPFHQRHTVDSLLALIPGAVELPGSPEPPRLDFTLFLSAVLDALGSWPKSGS